MPRTQQNPWFLQEKALEKNKAEIPIKTKVIKGF